MDVHVMRPRTDVTAIRACEGAETIRTPIVGRDVTGASAVA